MKKVLRWIGIAFLLAVVIIANNLTKPEREINTLKATNKTARLELWGQIWPVTSVALVLTLIIITLTAIIIGLRYLAKRAGESYARDGVWPIRYMRVRRGLRTALVVHDPNRSAGPTTIYADVGGADRIDVSQVYPDSIPPDQMRIAQGATLAQIASARGPNRQKGATNRGTQINLDLDDDGLHQPRLLYPEVPSPQRIPAGHIRRLMQEQGTLRPDQRSLDEEGNEVI